MNPTHARVVSFTVAGEPATKSRPRMTTRGGKVRTYTPDATKRAEAAMGAAFLARVGRLAPDERHMFEVEAAFYCGTGMRRDVDNMLKLVLDGLNKIAWADDNQVTSVIGRKVYVDADARSEVTIRPVGIMPNRKAICQRCGEEFPRPKSHAAKKYCSDDCRRAARRDARQKTCPTCGIKFTAHSEARGTYCSPKCHADASRVDVTCAACGTPFRKARSQNRRGNSYCSPECKATYWRDRRECAVKGTCSTCGGPTTKKTYKRCRDCHYAAGGRWADRTAESVKCPTCGSFMGAAGCSRCVQEAADDD